MDRGSEAPRCCYGGRVDLPGTQHGPWSCPVVLVTQDPNPTGGVTGVAGDDPATVVEVNDRGGRQAASSYFTRGLPMLAVLRLARILKEGAVKYEVDPWGDVTDRNWHRISSREHLEHAGTHYLKLVAGLEDGEDHLAHFVTRSVMALEMYLRESGETP